MIKCENTSIMNMDNAFRGMRNPLESWDKSDSKWEEGAMELSYPDWYMTESEFVLGPNDLDLAQRLIKAGSDERKFLRQIFVSVDITSSLYWWKEMDTYKVATVSNSTSTMHKLATRPITEDDFSMEDCDGICGQFSYELVQECEYLRLKYLETNNKQYWRALIQILPESYNQTRTWTANYETLRNIYHARKNHPLQEWRDFCKWIESLPYAEQLICN